MYIANVQTNNEWQDVADLVSTKTGESFAFSSDNIYHITNNSDYAVYLVNTDNQPSEKNEVGMRLPGGAQADFKPGTSVKLWAISFSGPRDLHIEQED